MYSLKTLFLSCVIINQGFNETMKNVQIENLYFKDCKFHQVYIFDLQFQNLKKLALISCINVDMKSLYKNLKDKQVNRLETLHIENTN